MGTKLNKADRDDGKWPRVGIGEFLLIVGLAVVFFLLAQSMVRHRFFEGGHYGRNGSIQQ